MKKGIIKLLFFQALFLLSGCRAIGEGFVLMSLIIGIPMFLLMFIGGIFSNLKHKGKYSSIDGNLFENVIGLIVILIFIFGFIKGCSN